MKNWAMRRTVFRARLSMIKKARDLYARVTEAEDIERRQLENFNTTWYYAWSTIPFYRNWKRIHALPDRIERTSDLDQFPALTKEVINENRDVIFNALPKHAATLSTGGSTGVPTVFPADPYFSESNYVNTYLGRGRWGIFPLDEMCLIWGHSHLFGTGLQGQLAQYKRLAADWLLNIRRYNAYNLCLDTLEKYVEAINRADPVAIIGYTSAIFKIAKYCHENQVSFRQKPNLKGVILTSETVTTADLSLVRSVFGAPCIIEYGMAEAGSIAYSHVESENLEIFWDSFIARARADGELIISTTRRGLFPLINYATTDRISVRNQIHGSILSIGLIQGRAKDIVVVRGLDGRPVHLGGLLLVHALKNHPGVYQIRFSQRDEAVVTISYVASSDVSPPKLKAYFYDNIRASCPGIDMDSFEFERVQNLPKTIAGKEVLIDRRNPWNA